MGSEHVVRHGLYLTVGNASDGRLIAICSDGSPQFGHEDVTVLDLKPVGSMTEAKAWFREFKRDRLRKERMH